MKKYQPRGNASTAPPPLEGEPIPLIVQTLEIPDKPLGGEDIALATRGIQTGRAGGPLRMWTENLKAWLQEATQEKDPFAQWWENLVSLAQISFKEGCLTDALTCTTMVLLTKGGGYFRGIVLVEVIWKLLTSINNNHLQSAITLHDALHGFRQGRGIRTSNLEAILLQKLAVIRLNHTFHMLLDVRKAYTLLDWKICM